VTAAPDLLAPILDEARARLRALRDRPEGAPTAPLVADALRLIYRLGVALGDHPALHDAPALRGFLDDTAAALAAEHVALVFYPGALVDEFEHAWEHDEWRQLVERRSGLQFFLDLYRDTALAPYVAELELADLDRRVRDWGTHDGFLPASQIEPGIPRSHWWWWLPEAPPP
jgi:hypothetical protein